MKSKKRISLLILVLCALVGGGVLVVNTFGRTVSTKFNSANTAVINEVRFDSAPSSSAVRHQRSAAQVEEAESKPIPRRREMRSGAARPAGAIKIVRRDRALGRAGSGGMVDSLAAAPREERSATTNDFAHYGVNQMTATAEDALSTFSIDVDTGAYTVARRMLNRRQLPPAASVRVEEFVNYFRYDYPDPELGAFGVHLEAAPSPFAPAENRKILRVGVQGKRATRASRKPVHLTFLVDVSGSMRGPDRIDLAKRSLKILTNNLGEDDTVAISTYAARVETVLEPTRVLNRGRIMDAIDRLRAGGSTAMGDGLQTAYKLAMSSFQADHVNRVLVLTDGDANVGPQSHTEILKSIRNYVEEGVTLSTIGFGMGNYKDTLMEQLANKGNGNYYYIDGENEARKVFGEQLDGTLQVIAKDVKIQVEFEPEAVLSYRLVGYENRDIADRDFRNDRVDAGEIGAGHTVTALYEIVLSKAAMSGALDNFATVRVRHKMPQGTTATEQAFPLTRSHLRASLSAASKDFQFAAAVAGFAEVLRGSEYAEGLSLALIEELARGASRADQASRQEFIGLVEKAKGLTKG